MHCHNDFGLATSNALQAFQLGVRCVDVTINGLGERCGLPPLAEVTAALDELFKVDHSWNLKKLKKMSSYMDRITKMDNRYTRPITGKYSFSHKAGIHVNAMLKNQSSYQSMSPRKLNRRHKIIIDKYTGRKAIQYRLEQLKIDYDEQLIDNIVLEIKSCLLYTSPSPRD